MHTGEPWQGEGGKVQLTDAMAQMIGTQLFHAMTFASKRCDADRRPGQPCSSLGPRGYRHHYPRLCARQAGSPPPAFLTRPAW